EIKPILVHAQAAMPNVVAFRSSLVMPNLPAEAGVDGPDIVRSAEVENAVHFQRGGLDDQWARVKSPGQGEQIHVPRVDLVEGAEAGARIVSIVGRPGVGRRLEQSRGIEPLRGSAQWTKTQGKEQRVNHKRRTLMYVSKHRYSCFSFFRVCR